jgi:hypothetical protein
VSLLAANLVLLIITLRSCGHMPEETQAAGGSHITVILPENLDEVIP